MDVIAVGGGIAVTQVLLAGAIGVAFRRAWRRALGVPVEVVAGLLSPDVAAEEIGPGVYRPDLRRALVAPALRDQRSLAALAVVLHEEGHYRQHVAWPLAVRLHWPLRTLATLLGGLGVLLVVGGLLVANRGIADLGALLYAGNVVAAFALVLLEWDASRRGIAILRSAKTPIASGLPFLLLLAALTYLAVAWIVLLPILQPETACSLPSSDDGADLPRVARKPSQQTRRGNHGESGTGDSVDQPRGGQGAVR